VHTAISLQDERIESVEDDLHALGVRTFDWEDDEY